MEYLSRATPLWVHEVGSGPPVVLLHPTPVHHEFWLPVALKLSDRFRVVLPDLRGHGRSESGEGPITINRLAEDIEALLDYLRIDRAIFAGCSLGSYVLYELWRRMPERLRGLAFMCGKPQADSATARSKRDEDIEKVRELGTGWFFDRAAQTLIGSTFRSKQSAEVQDVRNWMNGMSADSVIAVQQGIRDRPDSVKTVQTIKVPVLTVAAAEDPASTPGEMKVIADLLPTSRFELLPDAGHYAPYEQPESVAALLRRFAVSVPI